MALKLPEKLKFNGLGNKLKKADVKQLRSLAQRKAGPLLVFAADGFSLTGAVINLGKENPVIAYARADEWHRETALASVCQDLRQQTSKLPAEVIILHSQMVMAMLELPLPDNAELDNDKISEMVRWEMEGLYADNVAQPDIGWLLIGRGFLDDAQREDILEQLRENRQSLGTGSTTPLRFGDVAIRSGYITSDQLDEALAIQDDLQVADQRVLCGWQKLTSGKWLCSAIAASEHQRWLDVISKEKGKNLSRFTRLTRFYPLAGATAGLIDGNNATCLLEINPAFTALGEIKDGGWLSFTMRRTSTNELTPEAVVDFSGKRAKQNQCFITGTHPRFEALSAACSQWENSPWQVLPPPLGVENSSGAAAMLAVAQLHARPGQRLLQSVVGMGAAPAFYKSEWGKKAIAGLVVIAVLAGSEYYLNYQKQSLTDQVQEKKAQIKSREQLADKQNRIIQQQEKINAEVQKLQQDFESLTRRKELIERVLVQRQNFTEQLLPLIANSINDWVAINSIQETGWYVFNIAGYAVDQGAIDRFNQSLSQSLSDWKMFIKESPSSVMASGAYQFSFTVQPRPNVQEPAKQ